jgi:hypothetical protein
MPTPTITESRELRESKEKVRAIAGRIQAVFDEAGPERDFTRVRAIDGDTRGKLEKIRQWNTELDEAHDHVKALEQAEEIAAKALAMWRDDNEPAAPFVQPAQGGGGKDLRTVGKLLIASREYKEQKSRRQWSQPLDVPDLDIRAAVFRTGAGWDSQDIRIGRYELNPQRPIAVIDAVPMLPTSQAAIVYMEETTFTNNAAETAESTATTAADLIGEAALVLTERTRPVEWLPVFIPVTIQQMEDVDGIQEYVDARLTYMLRARLDSQILVGNGTTPNLLGTNSVSGIQTQAKGADPTPDAVYKCFTSIRADGFAEPSILFSHPNDWQDVRLLRTADGVYIWGSPADQGPDRIWGVPVVQTAAALQNTMTTGDYANFSTLFTKRGITITVSDSHAFYFTRGMLAIRADMPKAFGTITGV